MEYIQYKEGNLMRLQPDTWVGQLAPSQFGRTFSASKEIRGVFSNQKKKKEIWGVTAKDLPVWFGIINNIALRFFFIMLFNIRLR